MGVLPLSVLFTVGLAGNCEEWCKDSCLELNGDPKTECGGCKGPEYACRPGAQGFSGANLHTISSTTMAGTELDMRQFAGTPVRLSCSRCAQSLDVAQ